MVSKKFKIGIVDKKGKYSFLFQGFRKNKFSISGLETVMTVTSEEMVNYNIFFMVLYEYRDVFELLKFRDGGIPAIIASENVKIIKKLQILAGLRLIRRRQQLRADDARGRLAYGGRQHG